MKKHVTAAAGVMTALSLLGASAATAKPNGPAQNEVTFEVTIENVSDFGLLDTPRAGGTVPLSPGVYAVFNGAKNPLFKNGKTASAGIELIAEDGVTGTAAASLAANRKVSDSGTFVAENGMLAPAFFSGATGRFTFTASPGQRLSLATMFVQSNDFFLADKGHGIKLFNGTTPISGDITDQIDLWDAGTEVDTAPGTGPFQKPVQDPDATDFGPAENSVVMLASQTGDGFDLPADEAVIKVTITPIS